jgi:uncharacterized protein involved in outer membrane biogenesis
MKRKWIFRSAVGLAVVLIVVFVAAAFSLGTIVKKAVERVGPSAAQVDVKLGSAEVWLIAWRIQLTGIVLGNPPGYKTPTSLVVSNVTVRFKPGSVFSDKLVLASIKIKAPVITWEGGLGDNNLKKIEKNLDEYIGSSSTAPNSTAPSSSPATPERKLQVNELEITGAKLQINTLLSGGRTITVPIPDIYLTDLGSGPQGITPVEVGQRALHAVLTGATKAIAANGGQVGQEAVSGAKSAVQKATDSLKKLFHTGN